MNRKTSFLFLAVLLLQSAAACADSVKDALNHKYKNQILALRSPLTKGDQKFDSAGHSLSIAKSSGWLLYGGISVKKINLSPDTLRVEGNGATSYMEKRIGKVIVMPFGKARNIDIHLDQPLNSVDEVDAIMDRIFFSVPTLLTTSGLSSAGPMTTLQALRSIKSHSVSSAPRVRILRVPTVTMTRFFLPGQHIPLSRNFPRKLATRSTRGP